MQGDEKNLKDTSNGHPQTTSELAPNRSFGFPLNSYNKVNKLITALYMVTDILDKDEPIRLELRTLGVEVLSDIRLSLRDKNTDLRDKISTILSFLDITLDMNMISEMNVNILKKEFTDLKQSISEYKKQNNLWLENFINQASTSDEEESHMSDTNFNKGHIEFIKHAEQMSFNNKGPARNATPARNDSRSDSGRHSVAGGHNTKIGVQKGSTLLKALSKVGGTINGKPGSHNNRDSFNELKNKRREEIISIIRDTGNTDGLTITDIKNSAKGLLVSCGDKTLQRELISMVKDNVLYKKGDKRWSKYYTQNN